MTISIIGIGEVGSVLTAMLLARLRRTDINLVDTDTNLSGRLLDLRHAASLHDNTLHFNDQALISSSDFIFFCAGLSNPRNASRYTVARGNQEIVAEVFGKLPLKTGTTVVAVTNPVELVAQWISDLYEHRIRVLGTGTFLDTIRLKYLVAEHLDIPIASVQALVLGEHGRQMTPIYTHTLVDGRPVKEILDESELATITARLKGSATSIRQTEKATKYGVAQCALEILEAIHFKRETYMPLSVLASEEYKRLFDLQDELFLSLPCYIKEGDLIIDESLGFSEAEFDQLRLAASSVHENYSGLWGAEQKEKESEFGEN